MFVDQLLLVDVFSQLCYLTDAKKTKQQRWTYRYKSLKSWKIDYIDLIKQFSLSIFTNFRYQSIKITWLLSIFIYTDFYRLTTPGSKAHKKETQSFFKFWRLWNFFIDDIPTNKF